MKHVCRCALKREKKCSSRTSLASSTALAPSNSAHTVWPLTSKGKSTSMSLSTPIFHQSLLQIASMRMFLHRHARAGHVRLQPHPHPQPHPHHNRHTTSKPSGQTHRGILPDRRISSNTHTHMYTRMRRDPRRQRQTFPTSWPRRRSCFTRASAPRSRPSTPRR